MTGPSLLLHATCVALDGQAVLLAGTAGVGKTDVALRLMDHGGQLVSDDQTALCVTGGVLLAAPPAPIAGLIELRHVGLLRMPFVTDIPVRLYVELVAQDAPLERLPPAAIISFLDCPVRRLKLPGYAASTPAKIRLALQGSFEDA